MLSETSSPWLTLITRCVYSNCCSFPLISVTFSSLFIFLSPSLLLMHRQLSVTHSIVDLHLAVSRAHYLLQYLLCFWDPFIFPIHSSIHFIHLFIIHPSIQFICSIGDRNPALTHLLTYPPTHLLTHPLIHLLICTLLNCVYAGLTMGVYHIRYPRYSFTHSSTQTDPLTGSPIHLLANCTLINSVYVGLTMGVYHIRYPRYSFTHSSTQTDPLTGSPIHPLANCTLINSVYAGLAMDVHPIRYPRYSLTHSSTQTHPPPHLFTYSPTC